MTRVAGPTPLLFLFADTGGGHRSAAKAVTQALDATYPGQFAPVLHDPFRGPDAPRLLQWVSGLYGPMVRHAPWTWRAAYHGTSPRLALRLTQSTLFDLANRSVTDAATRLRPAAIVSFHPLLARAAVTASRHQHSGRPPVLTVITDLVTAHRAWRDDGVDRIVAPSSVVRLRCRLDGLTSERCLELGLPVTSDFWSGPATSRQRTAMRHQLGVGNARFLVVLAGGAEGSGSLASRAAALLEQVDDITVVAICGRNQVARNKLARLARHQPERLTVKGFVDNMSDWLHAADVVVSKAGPSTIAEATCCGTPLVLTSYLPGQENGNAEFVVDAGAGRFAPSNAGLVRVIDELRHDPLAVRAMRVASARLGRPNAAVEVADLIARTVRPALTVGRSA